MHNDICCSFPLFDMLNFHLEHDKKVSIMSKKVKASESLRYGCFINDPENDNEIIHYQEKPQ